MSPRLERFYGSGHLHFITCSCYRRRPFLRGADQRDRFLRILEQVRLRYRFVVVGRRGWCGWMKVGEGFRFETGWHRRCPRQRDSRPLQKRKGRGTHLSGMGMERLRIWAALPG